MKCIRRFMLPVTWVLPTVWALGAGAIARSAPVHVEDVFPPGVSVCALPPAHEAVPALDVGDPAPMPVPPDDARDLRTLRWLHVDARPLSQEIPLEIADGTVGVTLRAESPDPAWNVAVELLSESGELLACEECEDAAIVGETRPGRGSLQVPSTDRPGGDLRPGRYTFRVRATPAHPKTSVGASPGAVGDGVTVDILATFRTDVSVHVQHRLDLNFVYTPNCTLSAELALSSPRFQEFLQRIDQWLAPSGIRVGTVTHVNLDRPDFDIVTTWEEAGRMFRTSARVGRPRALNVYCVQGFDTPLNPVVGLSGGVPGPVLNGTRDSGIAIRMSPFFVCSDCLGAFASLMAHEIGHYLGFYHTTESDLAHWDPVLDTPECTADFPYGCADFSYVMFPLIHSANVVWSPAQIGIAQTHPLVRTVPVVRSIRSDPVDDASRAVAAPNPFRDRVRFAWSRLPADGTTGRTGDPGAARAVPTATVHDIRGRLVRRLAGADGALEWDGRADDGTPAPAGIYFARIRDGAGRVATTRVVKAR